MPPPDAAAETAKKKRNRNIQCWADPSNIDCVK
jgi:hypothetical protein